MAQGLTTAVTTSGRYLLRLRAGASSEPGARSCGFQGFRVVRVLGERPQGYEEAGETRNVVEAIQWGADYLMKAHTSPTTFVAQVGNRLIDGKRPRLRGSSGF